MRIREGEAAKETELCGIREGEATKETELCGSSKENRRMLFCKLEEPSETTEKVIIK